MTLEKRRFPRKLISRLAGIERLEGNIQMGVVGNISRSGMLIKTREKFTKKGHYRFFIAGKKGMLEIEGKAIRCRKTKDIFDVHVVFDRIFKKPC